MASAPSPSPDEGLAVGSVLDGRYRIDAVIGTGGMGRVYRGEHTGIGRAVAIKVLHTDLSRNREAAQRFQREALASGRLDHPNIVAVSDFGVLDDGSCYLVMEALDGEPLGARLERDKRIEWHEALEILRGVLSGLKHAHDKGVVHRDIKPDNIFLAQKEGEIVVKILDFGIAKLYAGSADDPASTRAGLTVGTPAYLSPEQAVGGEITPASDLYSASVVLFEMLAGRTPFVEKEPLAQLGAHVSRPPPALAEVAPDIEIPPGLEEVLARGLAKVMAERFTKASDYIGAIDAVLAGVPLSSARELGNAQTALLPTENAADASVMIEVIPGTSTPVPGRYATPAAGVVRTPVGGVARVTVPGAMRTPPGGVARTPVPGTLQAPVAGAAPTPHGAPSSSERISLESARRAISLADITEPVPKRWLVIGAIVLGAGILIALVSWIAGGSSKASKSGATTPVVMPVPIKTIDKEVELKAYLHDLQTGKTCADRKAAIPMLVELGDPRAIEPLKKARYRMTGGLLGFGQDNSNSCLKADAEAAVKKLGGTIR